MTFTWRPRELWCWLTKRLTWRNLAIWTGLVLEKELFQCFWAPREINSRFDSKTQWQIFLLVSDRHVGAQLDGHQHGVSIQISINLGKQFLRIFYIRNIAVTWILARVYLPSFLSQILDFERFWFLFWSIILNGVALKTSNLVLLVCIWHNGNTSMNVHDKNPAKVTANKHRTTFQNKIRL